MAADCVVHRLHPSSLSQKLFKCLLCAKDELQIWGSVVNLYSLWEKVQK